MHTIIHGDCLEELKKLEDSSVDAVITDPPYGLSNTKPAQVADVLAAWVTGETEAVPAKRGGFMGKDWDSFVPPPAVWAECMRVLKPGGHMAVFAGARTQDLMGLSIRLAGFEIRDTLGWIYGSGFPKSMDVSKAIDKAAGEEREVIGSKVTGNAKQRTSATGEFADGNHGGQQVVDITAPATDDAARWDGWGTALKPAIEPIILARKPLDGTVASNVLAHGVGGLNIDACRVGMSDADREYIESRISGFDNTRSIGGNGAYSGGQVMDRAEAYDGSKGRFPANVLLDEHAAKEMDKQSVGTRAEKPSKSGTAGATVQEATWKCWHKPGEEIAGYNDSGGASRFFPVFKSEEETPETKGRFPANVLLDEHAAAEMDKQSGVRDDRGGVGNKAKDERDFPSSYSLKGAPKIAYNGSGGASRYFPVFKYQAKAPKKERPVIVREDGTKVQHPTVKPLKLMEWLVTLITPEGGTVLDPFAGTGTTLQAATNKGFHPIGIEADADYIQLIHKRLEGGEQSTRSS